MDPERGPCVRSIAFPLVLLWFCMCFVESMHVRFEGRLAEHGGCPDVKNAESVFSTFFARTFFLHFFFKKT